MAWRSRSMLLLGTACVLVVTDVPVAGQNGPALRSESSARIASIGPDMFVGVWAYNEDESVNAATGRQERSPRSATLRSPVARGAGAGASEVVRAGGGLAPPPTSPGGIPSNPFGPSGQIGPTVAMIQENRSLTRDLLEVPESLTIRVGSGAVTFVDDLARERVYATGVRSRYQLGAARFNAVVEWTGPQLVKRIDAADGFRMTETYFLSEDADRLFVIVRIGSNRKDSPIMGVNRVYDRVEQ